MKPNNAPKSTAAALKEKGELRAKQRGKADGKQLDEEGRLKNKDEKEESTGEDQDSSEDGEEEEKGEEDDSDGDGQEAQMYEISNKEELGNILQDTVKQLMELDIKDLQGYRAIWRKMARLHEALSSPDGCSLTATSTTTETKTTIDKEQEQEGEGEDEAAAAAVVVPFSKWVQKELPGPIIDRCIRAEFNLIWNKKPTKSVRERMGTAMRAVNLETFQRLFLFFGESATSIRFLAELSGVTPAMRTRHAHLRSTTAQSPSEAAAASTSTSLQAAADARDARDVQDRQDRQDAQNTFWTVAYPVLMSNCCNQNYNKKEINNRNITSLLSPASSWPVLALSTCKVRLMPEQIRLAVSSAFQDHNASRVSSAAPPSTPEKAEAATPAAAAASRPRRKNRTTTLDSLVGLDVAQRTKGNSKKNKRNAVVVMSDERGDTARTDSHSHDRGPNDDESYSQMEVGRGTESALPDVPNLSGNSSSSSNTFQMSRPTFPVSSSPNGTNKAGSDALGNEEWETTNETIDAVDKGLDGDMGMNFTGDGRADSTGEVATGGGQEKKEATKRGHSVSRPSLTVEHEIGSSIVNKKQKLSPTTAAAASASHVATERVVNITVLSDDDQDSNDTTQVQTEFTKSMQLSMSRLSDDTAWLDDEVMRTSANLLVSLNSDFVHIQIGSPSGVLAGQFERFRRQVELSKAQHILAVINLDNQHWLLGRADASQKQLLIYDSLPSDSHFKDAKTIMRNMVEAVLGSSNDGERVRGWPCTAAAAVARQHDSSSCGIHTLVNLLHIVTNNHKLPERVEPRLWRAILLGLLLEPDSAQNGATHLQTHHPADALVRSLVESISAAGQERPSPGPLAATLGGGGGYQELLRAAQQSAAMEKTQLERQMQYARRVRDELGSAQLMLHELYSYVPRVTAQLHSVVATADETTEKLQQAIAAIERSREAIAHPLVTSHLVLAGRSVGGHGAAHDIHAFPADSSHPSPPAPGPDQLAQLQAALGLEEATARATRRRLDTARISSQNLNRVLGAVDFYGHYASLVAVERDCCARREKAEKVVRLMLA